MFYSDCFARFPFGHNSVQNASLWASFVRGFRRILYRAEFRVVKCARAHMSDPRASCFNCFVIVFVDNILNVLFFIF